jgi:hypothetical protein
MATGRLADRFPGELLWRELRSMPNHYDEDVSSLHRRSQAPIQDAQEVRAYAVACAARVRACISQGQQLTQAAFNAVAPDVPRVDVAYWGIFEEAFSQAYGASTGEALAQCAERLAPEALKPLGEDARRILREHADAPERARAIAQPVPYL